MFGIRILTVSNNFLLTRTADYRCERTACTVGTRPRTREEGKRTLNEQDRSDHDGDSQINR